MEKSIEKIWQNAFISEEDLKAPQVNNLFERKSVLIVDKLIGRMQRDFKILFPLFLMTFVINFLLGNSLTWSILGVLPFIPWFFIGYKQIKSMKSIPTDDNCLDYLIEVEKEIRRITKFNHRAAVGSIFVVGFPTFLYTYIKQQDKTIGEMFGVQGLDLHALWIFAIIPIVMLFVYVLFGVMHKLTNGTEAKLRELISDLESLKS